MLKLSTTLFERSIIPYKKLIYRKGRKFTLEKLFSSLLITSLILGLIFAIKVYSNAGVKSGADIDTADIKTSDYDFLIEYKKQENALKNWDKFVTEFNKRNAGRVTGYVEDPFPSNYSGSFIDDYGNLHINLVETPGHVSGDELKTFFDDDSVKIHKVKYTIKELDDFMSALFDRMEELGIKAMMRDDINNKIYVYITDINDSMKKDMITEIVPSDCIEFKEEDIKVIFQTDTASTTDSTSTTVLAGTSPVRAGSPGPLN